MKLSRVHDKKITVDYTTKDKTAEAGSDYVAKNGTLSFRAGQKKKTVRVGVIEDDVHELVETFALKLKNATRATIADRTGIGTINDDDAPTITAVDASLGESNAPFTNGLPLVVFSLSHASPLPISVTVSLASDTTGDHQATFDTDYLNHYGGPTTIVVPPGETAGWYEVRFRGDDIDEFNETYLAVLSSPTNGATIADDTSVITINDNDDMPILQINDPSVVEGDGSSCNTMLTFNITLSAASGKTVGTSYATRDGNAVSTGGSPDYLSSGIGQLTFEPGQTTKTVDVDVCPDNLDENNETVLLDLFNVTNAFNPDAVGNGTIIDDDP